MEGWWQTTAVPESSMVGLCGALVKLCKQISPPGQTLFFSILFFPDFFAGTIFSETKKSSKDENCISTFLFLGFFSRTGFSPGPSSSSGCKQCFSYASLVVSSHSYLAFTESWNAIHDLMSYPLQNILKLTLVIVTVKT